MKTFQFAKKLFVLFVFLFVTISFIKSTPRIAAGGNNSTNTRGECMYLVADKIYPQSQSWIILNPSVVYNSNWVADPNYLSSDHLYVKFKNVKENAILRRCSYGIGIFLLTLKKFHLI